MKEQYINDLAKRVFEQNKAAGWWDNMDRDIHEALMLVVTEIAEATEGVRKDLMDDHLPHRKMEEVELADTIIRLLDLAGRYGWKYQPTYHMDSISMEYDKTGKSMPPASEHFAAVVLVVEIAQEIMKPKNDSYPHWPYSELIGLLLSVSFDREYDIELAIEEKLAYNRNRADHKRENREKEGGKKF